MGVGVVVGGSGGGGGGGGAGTTASAVWMDSALTSGWSSTGVKPTTMLEVFAITWQTNAQAASAMLVCKRCLLEIMANFCESSRWHREGDRRSPVLVAS